MKMKKKIVFLDGAGTLWYPKATKRTQKPHWIYHDPETKDNYLEHLELTPRTKETLELLKANKKINFWRTTTNQEIDFIINEKELYAIEAKYNFNNIDNKSLKIFSKNYKCNIVNVGLKGEKRGKYIWELIKELGR